MCLLIFANFCMWSSKYQSLFFVFICQCTKLINSTFYNIYDCSIFMWLLQATIIRMIWYKWGTSSLFRWMSTDCCFQRKLPQSRCDQTGWYQTIPIGQWVLVHLDRATVQHVQYREKWKWHLIQQVWSKNKDQGIWLEKHFYLQLTVVSGNQLRKARVQLGRTNLDFTYSEILHIIQVAVINLGSCQLLNLHNICTHLIYILTLSSRFNKLFTILRIVEFP